MESQSEKIRIACECGKRLRVAPNMAGRRVKCPSCQQPIEVPAAPTSTFQSAAPPAPPIEQPDDDDSLGLTPLQIIGACGLLLMAFALCFFFIRQDGAMWKAAGGIGMLCIVIAKHKEIAVSFAESMELARQTIANRRAAKSETQPAEPQPQSPQPVAARPSQVVIHNETSPGGCLPAIASFFIPGLGQAMKGQILNGIAWFFVVSAAYVLTFFLLGLGGMFFHVLCILGAASGGGSRSTVVVRN